MPVSIASLTYRDVAKTIDHSLLRPELDDAFVADGCRLGRAEDGAAGGVGPPAGGRGGYLAATPP